MSADVREAMLGRIRAANAVLYRGRVDAQDAIARDYQLRGLLDTEACLYLFMERLREYDTQVIETYAAGLPTAIGSVLNERARGDVIVADQFPPESLPRDRVFRWEKEASDAELDACDGIITACRVAIAMTGTIVLRHGPGEGARKFTLLPDRHLCVVHADQVVETVPEAFAWLAEFARDPLTTISGPSATADIEMTRIRGVHGPRFLDVVLVRD